MTVELLPCSKCRRVPDGDRDAAPNRLLSQIWYLTCESHYVISCRGFDVAVSEWNRRHGSPLTLAERPQDVPACDADDGVKLLHDRVHVEIGKARAAKAVRVRPRVDDDEPSVGDGVRVVPSAASCVERGRSCADGSVGACSGGVR